MAAFVVDAQLPPGMARHLRQLGHDAVHVGEIGLQGAQDYIIAAAVVSRTAILVSKDEHFFALMQSGRLHCRLWWIRMGNTSNAALLRRVSLVLPDTLAAFARGETLVELR